jgi:hypothetical protein
MAEHEVAAVLVRCLDATPPGTHPFTWGETWKTACSARRRWQETREAEVAEALETMRRWKSGV